MANCDIPDLDLLPQKYGIKNIRFFAGMESSILHLGIWLISWLVRMKLLLHLSDYSLFLLRMSHLFDWLGTADGGMHIIIKGRDQDDKPKEIKWFIIAKNGDGPQIPSIPAIILAKKLLFKKLDYIGASACVGLVSLDEYMNELEEFNIETYN